MKRVLLLVLALFFSAASFAQQKVGYLYSEKVFETMPEYNRAIATLNKLAETQRKKVDAKLEEVQKAYKQYEERVKFMTTSQASAARERIIKMEREMNEYEEQIFGEDGVLEKRQKELMEPIEGKVISVVNRYATANDYDMIYDFSVMKNTIYESKRLDLTNKIIKQISK